MKEKSGITLIALIITIIVLLILAGVSVSILTGDNGVLNQAQESKIKTEQAHIEEMKQLTSAKAAMNLEGYTYIDKKGVSVYIPTSFAVSENPDEQLVENGLVVIDKMGDEFVWVPVNVPDGQTIDDVFKKRAGKNGASITADGEQNGGNAPTAQDILNLKDNYGNNSWLETSENAGEAEIVALMNKEKMLVNNAGGFYISRYEIGLDGTEQRKLNDDINYLTGTSSNVEFYWHDARVADSIATTDSNNPVKLNRQAIIDRIKPKLNSKKGIEPIRRISQDESLWLANEWKSGKDYQSGLITGRTWDTALNWSFNTANSNENLNGYVNADGDCKNFGNYKNSSSIIYSNIFHSNGSGGKWLKEDNFDKKDTEGIIFPTGEFINSINLNTTAMKNIYDMAGNVWEWTTEIPYIEQNRIFRGGSACDSGLFASPTRRAGIYSCKSDNASSVGFRVVIYVKVM